MPLLFAQKPPRRLRAATASMEIQAISNRRSFPVGHGRAPDQISRYIGGGNENDSNPPRSALGQRRDPSPSLLDSSKPEARKEELSLASGVHRYAKASGDASARSPESPGPTARVTPQRASTVGNVSRRMAPGHSNGVHSQVKVDQSASASREVTVVSRDAIPPPEQQPVASTARKQPFEAWEIEFLASKVYSYLKQKLTIERERHGRPGSPQWP